ncbi:MAG TPA: biotin--[acetyl-CoA-carboxylase] ligase [Candidatus Limnocylindria bacterium]|nr:biotin--[acetyl-CoA-carboxylase] ligase [Candidatus Limnocylindria bacterium]
MARLALLAHPAVASAFGRELGRDVEYHARLASTQDRARALAEKGAVRGVVVADEQTAGQGTHGRAWVSPPATSLLASWILRPAPAAPALFAALAGVAIARALEALGVGGARLKWPNDVELSGRKVAGALAHATSDGGGGVLVLGIGVNAHQRAADFPPELRGLATSCALAGTRVDRLALLARLTRELDRLEVPADRGSAMDEWRARSTLLGKPVTVRIEGRDAFTATATAIDDEGALVVHTPSGVERIVTGDVRLA